MKTIQDVIDSLENQGLDQYKEVMRYCDSRVTADEGIPAVIGLDDLTEAFNTTYQGAKEDTDFRFLMAVGAMIFASLYEQSDPEVLGNYPGIAPAMSAMAEMFFHAGKDRETVPYREVIKAFLVTEKECIGGKQDGGEQDGGK